MLNSFRLRRFAGDTSGSLSIEAAMMAPLAIFIIQLFFSAFDIFRYDAVNAKAAYTIGDLLSRETDPVNQKFIDGMRDIFDYMVPLHDDGTWLRVSLVRHDGDDDRDKLVWSHVSGGAPELADLTTIADEIPAMAEEDVVIVVETFMPYRTPFRVGIRLDGFHNTVVTRPRFSSQLDWED